MTRDVHHLNHSWRFRARFRPEYLDPGFDDSGFDVVDVPHTVVEVPYNDIDPASYQLVSTYRRRLDVGPLPSGRRALLQFDGVMVAADVYLDGTLVGSHVGGYTPWVVDVTEHLAPSGRGLVAVVVDSTERADAPPFGGALDYLALGGIYREVRLEVVDAVRIDSVATRGRGVLTNAATLDVDVEVVSTASVPRLRRAEVVVLRDGAVVARRSRRVRVAAAGAEPSRRTATLSLALGRVRLWSPDSPTLYDLVVTLRGPGCAGDELRLRTGFREAVFTSGGFFLNGARTTIRGLNRHESFPYVGAAMPRSAHVRDAEILRHDLGVNAVRLSHYPQSPHFLDACDALGLLVFEEMPGWQHIGDDAWKSRALADVEAMIRRDRNRPSVVAWGVRINESPDDDAFYRATNALAHRLDPTRPTGGVRNFGGSHLLEDVYTYNDFVHRGDNEALRPRRTVTRRAVPYLVTEHTGHMYPTKTYDTEARRLEHALRHLRVLDAAYASSDIAGVFGWCMVDYATHREFGSGDRICHHGVLDAFRIPKTAAAVYASQQDESPVLELASALVPGDVDGADLRTLHIFTNCEEVRLCRDGVEIGVFAPDRAGYPAVPHPPVVARDLIGGLLERNEGFSARDAARTKDVLSALATGGVDALTARQRRRVAQLRAKYRMSRAEAMALFTGYVAGWGAEAIRYDAVGFRDGTAVASATRCADGPSELRVRADTNVLEEGTTYDVVRVVVTVVDGVGTRLTYADVVVRLDVDGPGAVIGPTTVALVGGSRAFWVRTTRGEGPLTVKVTTERLGSRSVRLDVRRRGAPEAVRGGPWR